MAVMTRKKETIGERIARLRRERGLSQMDLAGPTVSASYRSRVEGGTRRPSMAVIAAVAEKLGVEPAEVEFGTADNVRMLRDANRLLRMENLRLAAALATTQGQLAKLRLSLDA